MRDIVGIKAQLAGGAVAPQRFVRLAGRRHITGDGRIGKRT